MRSGSFLLACAVLLGGCASDAPRYAGETGLARAITLLADVPAADSHVEVGTLRADGPLLLDTGSPVSVIDVSDLGAAAPAWHAAELGVLGLRFFDVDVAVFELFDDSTCAAPRPVGILGGDLLRQFAVDLDYRAQTATLHDGALPPFSPDESVTPTPVPLQVLGGGPATITGLAGTRSLAATRALVQLEVEGVARWAMLDTGATVTTVHPRVVAPDAATRPQACCFSVTTAVGPQQLPMARLRDVAIDRGLSLSEVAVLIGDETLFELLSAEVGRDVDLLLGANVLARFALRLDLRRGELQLARYANEDHLLADPWLLPGFSFCRTKAGQALVQDVFVGSVAAARGLRGGEHVVAVDGQSVVGLDDRALRALLVGGGEGDTLSIDLAERVAPLAVEVERVLPYFAP